MAWWGRTEIWGGDMEKKPMRGREGGNTYWDLVITTRGKGR